MLHTDLLKSNQQQEQLIVPLSNPQKTGSLNIDLVSSLINVNSHDKKEVVIYARSKCNNLYIPPNESNAKVYTNNIGIIAKEEKNTINISTSFFLKSLYLDIRVPKNFSLNLKTVNGKISVSNVSGDFIIKNINNDILLHNIKGSVDAYTTNGKIHVDYENTQPSTKILLNSVNKNINLTLPKDTNADVELKPNNNNAFFVDFNLELETLKTDSQKTTSSVPKSASVIRGKINNGGTKIMMKSLNGAILIQKK